ncbi:MAG TPA: cupredoxin domain-containing protein [Cyclobacteriaceae bacterium]|nr:cupredoxin domain-containing protein [Cyclobacteriaceae bacterium]
MKSLKFVSIAALVLLSSALFAQKNPQTVKLEQTPGKFTTEQLTLKPGSYVFEVSNKGIDHEVAFFLQSEKDKESGEYSTAIANSGLSKTIRDGESAKSGVIELKKGTYVYSCPLNPTPKYTIVVE